jgi:hypothetical protein
MSMAEHQILHQAVRRLGSLAHQAHASLRAADRFVVQGGDADRDTAGWLVCTAVEQVREIAAELDDLARGMRATGSDATREQTLAGWRRLAHQLHAAAHAADVFLEQESSDDQTTGTWLVASTLGLAQRLASAFDDQTSAWSASLAPARRVAAAGPRSAG